MAHPHPHVLVRIIHCFWRICMAVTQHCAGVENSEENRRAYRDLLFTTPGLGQYISGAICFEETLFHSTADGTPFAEVLKKAGIVPGIKVDKGTMEIAGTDGETVTDGIDDLGKRCQKYYAAGARFAKWYVEPLPLHFVAQLAVAQCLEVRRACERPHCFCSTHTLRISLPVTHP